MNSISKDCQELKEKYDACFNDWFRDRFLKGLSGDPCSELFTSYQACVKKAIKDQGIVLAEVERNVLNTPDEKKFDQ